MITIDNIPITNFSAFSLSDYTGVVSYPPLKKVESNDWAEEHGLEVDLSAPRLDKKEFEISFLLKDKNKYDNLVNYLTETTYRIWNFTEIQKEFRLRVVGFSSYNEFLEKSEIKIKVSDDFPLRNFSYISANMNFGTESWKIDNAPFSKYGIYVLEESKNIHREEEAKSILEMTNNSINGVKVHTQPLKLKSRKATLRCYLKANLDDFWQHYEQFLHDLSKAGQRTLITDRKIYKFHYQSSKVTSFLKTENIIRCDFTLELNII